MTERARRVAERYAAAWLAGDLAALLDCYADEFTLHYFGRSRFAGDHVGKQAAVTALLEVGAAAPRTLLGVDEITSAPGAAVIVARERLEGGGESFEVRRLFRYRIDGDQLVECWLYDEDQTLIDRLWAGGGGGC